MNNIKITKVQQSASSNVDFNNIPFGKTFTDHMFVADYINGEWTNMEIVPLSKLSIHPGNLAWHYGQSIFEGMKATRDAAGTPLLFRPEQHIYRLNASARRMCMPELPEEVFLEAVHTLVRLEKDWIPPQEGSALYIRPFMFAMDEAIGVRPSDTYKFIICTLPVGPYYPKPVKLKAEETYIRAAQGGVGEAKTAGNYAASLYPAKLAKEEGYDQIMWLDAKEFKYVQEVGTMNIFFVIGDEVITPETEGTILKGITRMTIIEILKDQGYTVTERRISIDEVMEAADRGDLKEVFGTGTAAVIAVVNEIKYREKIVHLNPDEYVVAPLAKKTINGLRNRTIEDAKGWVIEAGATVEA
ncbi:MAG: branched-chain amino acid aminotransferase [Bacteroidota bacterium]